MGTFAKYRFEIILSILFSIAYFLIRLPQLTHNPIFTDEAIYLRWAQIALQDPAWTFISLSDGKQPLFIWLVMPLLRIFSDPLFAGRFVSVVAGFVTMAGLGGLTYILFKNRWLSFLSSFLYLLYPMAYVYDRIALYDSLVGTFYVLGLLLSVLLVKFRRLDIALLFGLVIGGGLLTKTNVMFLIYLLPFTLILFDWDHKKRRKELSKWGGLVILSIVLAFSIESFLRLSPYYYIIAEKNAVFVVPIKEWLGNPLYYVMGNFRGLTGWFFEYFSIPAFILAVGSVVISREYWREKVLLLIFFFAPFMALAIFGRVIYPRYLFFMTLPLLPLISYSLFVLLERFSARLRPLIFLLLLSPFLLLTISLMQDYKSAPIPETDKQQYMTSWPAGNGVRDSVAFFKEQAKDNNIFIATQGELGLLPYAFEIYLDKDPHITIEGYWPIEDTMPKEILEKSQTMPTYVVFYQPCPTCKKTGIAPTTWPLEIVEQITNPDGTYYTVYKVKR